LPAGLFPFGLGGLGGLNFAHDAGFAALGALFGLAAGVHLAAAFFASEDGHRILLNESMFLFSTGVKPLPTIVVRQGISL
jgi:hypothetical protein